MGYRRNRTVPLVFTGEMAEFEATAKVVSIDDWFDAAALARHGLVFLPENKERIDKLIGLVVDNITEWNLDDEDGDRLPVTVEAFKTQDKWFQATVIDAWIDQMVQVKDPLDRPSSSGPSAEGTDLAEIPMTEIDPTSLAS